MPELRGRGKRFFQAVDNILKKECSFIDPEIIEITEIKKCEILRNIFHTEEYYESNIEISSDEEKSTPCLQIVVPKFEDPLKFYHGEDFCFGWMELM